MKTEIARYLIVLTIASSVAIVITLAMRRALRVLFGAAASYAAWLLVPAAMVAVLLPTPRSRGVTLELPLRVDKASALSHALDRSLGSLLQTASSTDWASLGLIAWCVGAGLFLVYLAGVQRAFVGSLGALSGSRRVLRAERSAGCPALLGILRPRIVLPADFESRYNRLERLLIFSHERTHLGRGDALWNALAALMRCLFWFNPLVHLAAICLRADQEMACDAAVLDGHPGSRRAYATAMLKTQLADAALPIGCHWRSAHQLKERLQMVGKSTPSRGRRVCGNVFVAIASLVLGYAAWAAEPSPPASTADTATGIEPQHELHGPHLQMRLRTQSPVTFNADSMIGGLDGTTVFQGHVRIEASVPTTHRTPAGETETIDWRDSIIEAEKVVMTKQSDGVVILDIENGSVKY
jgi:beta-lactamase regulating signal transducer with metallopeptidase domain